MRITKVLIMTRGTQNGGFSLLSTCYPPSAQSSLFMTCSGQVPSVYLIPDTRFVLFVSFIASILRTHVLAGTQELALARLDGWSVPIPPTCYGNSFFFLLGESDLEKGYYFGLYR